MKSTDEGGGLKRQTLKQETAGHSPLLFPNLVPKA